MKISTFCLMVLLIVFVFSINVKAEDRYGRDRYYRECERYSYVVREYPTRPAYYVESPVIVYPVYTPVVIYPTPVVVYRPVEVCPVWMSNFVFQIRCHIR